MIISGIEKIEYVDKSSGELKTFYNLYSFNDINSVNGVGQRCQNYSFTDEALTNSNLTFQDLLDAFNQHWQVMTETVQAKGRYYIRQFAIIPVSVK